MDPNNKTETENDSTNYQGTDIFLLVFTSLVFTIGFLGNSVVIRVFLVKPDKSCTHMLILALATVDLVSCFTTLPFELTRTILQKEQEVSCTLEYMFTIPCNVTSILITTTIAIERYFATCRPYQFKKIVTKSCTKLSIFLSILIPILFSTTFTLIFLFVFNADCSLIGMGNNWFANIVFFLNFITFTLCSVTVLILYFHIYRTLRQQRRVVAAKLKGKTQFDARKEYDKVANVLRAINHNKHQKEACSNSQTGSTTSAHCNTHQLIIGKHVSTKCKWKALKIQENISSDEKNVAENNRHVSVETKSKSIHTEIFASGKSPLAEAHKENSTVTPTPPLLFVSGANNSMSLTHISSPDGSSLLTQQDILYDSCITPVDPENKFISEKSENLANRIVLQKHSVTSGHVENKSVQKTNQDVTSEDRTNMYVVKEIGEDTSDSHDMATLPRRTVFLPEDHIPTKGSGVIESRYLDNSSDSGSTYTSHVFVNNFASESWEFVNNDNTSRSLPCRSQNPSSADASASQGSDHIHVITSSLKVEEGFSTRREMDHEKPFETTPQTHVEVISQDTNVQPYQDVKGELKQTHKDLPNNTDNKPNIKKGCLKLQRQNSSLEIDPKFGGVNASSSARCSYRYTSDRDQARGKTTSMLLFVSIIFIATWIPYWICSFIEIAIGKTNNVLLIFKHLYIINMACNPIVYSFLNARFRTECTATLTLLKNARRFRDYLRDLRKT